MFKWLYLLIYRYVDRQPSSKPKKMATVTDFMSSTGISEQEIEEQACEKAPALDLYSFFKLAVISQGTLIWRSRAPSLCLVVNDVDLAGCTFKVLVYFGHGH
jgi:hypothetical protein